MKSLVFLQTRRIKNGVKRAFETPVRALMTIGMIGYFGFMLSLFIFTPAAKQALPVKDMAGIDLRLAANIIILAHLLFLALVLPSPKFLYSILIEPDVPNLYPVPYRPWQVVRYFLFTRAFPLNIFLTGIISVYMFKIIHYMVLKKIPELQPGHETAGVFVYAGLMVVSLIAMQQWRLFIDMLRELRLIPARVFSVAIICYGILLMLCFSYAASAGRAEGMTRLQSAGNAVDWLPVTVLLIPFRIHAEILMGRVELLSVSVAAAFIFWGGSAAGGYFILSRQGNRLYEYADRLLAFRMRMTEVARNPALSLREQYAKSKISMNVPWFIRGIKFRRGGGIVWREVLTSWRGVGSQLKFISFAVAGLIVAGWIASRYFGFAVKDTMIWACSILIMSILGLIFSMMSPISFTEIFKRFEIEKPLPVTSLECAAIHISTWALLSYAMTFLPYTTGLLLFSRHWKIIIIVVIIGWTSIYPLICSFYLVMLYNPDINDPVQRMYLPIFGLLLAGLSLIPAIGGVAGGKILHWPFMSICVVTVLGNAASSIVLLLLSARKYEKFQFTE